MTDRLSRGELAWLLAQEARSASQKLRQGVGVATITEAPPIVEESTGGVERTLEQLDEAVTMLANLYGGGAAKWAKRGKIDVAALVWEVAPEARAQIEMGEGTSVYGEETELRRMLHVLLGQAGKGTGPTAGADVTVRRVDDEVRVGVSLGPDPAATFETERDWLARMATRYGGRLELDGTMQTLVLPADVDEGKRELESLRKELVAAQQQGVAYKRELAAHKDSPADSEPVPRTEPEGAPRELPSLHLLAVAARSLGAELRGIFSAIGRDIAPLRGAEGEPGDIAASVGRHVMAASDIIAELGWIAATPSDESPSDADLADVLREVVRAASPRAARRGVTLSVDAPDGAFDVTLVGTLTALLHALVEQAVESTAAGQVAITVRDHADRTEFTFVDRGPAVPASAAGSLVSRDLDTAQLGRPATPSLHIAQSLAGVLRARLDLAPAGETGASLKLVLPRTS